jgi:hypothetical protein
MIQINLYFRFYFKIICAVAKRLILLLLLFSFNASGQLPLSETEFVNQLKLSGGFPPKLLSTRTVVYYSYGMTEAELLQVQDYFQRTGIDAVGHFTIDILTAGKEINKAMADFLQKREITNLAFVEKNADKTRITLTLFNNKESLFDKGQPAWSVENRLLLEALKVLNRSALAELKKENLLINHHPETEIIINPITGKRNEFYAVDMKVDLVAIPKFGYEAMDKELETLVAANFPFAYKLVEPTLTEKELRKQGFLYIMHVVHTRGALARDLLGYTESKPETAIVSVTYPDTQLQLKTFPSNAVVFKFFFKHIDSGNVFLGTKWDADLTWQQAFLNNIRGMKAELRLN